MSSDVLSHVRKDLRDIHPALSVFLEREDGRHQRTRMALPHHDLALARERLSRVFLKRGFGVERVHVARAAAHEQRDHTLGAGREVRLLGRVTASDRRPAPGRSSHWPAGGLDRASKPAPDRSHRRRSGKENHAATKSSSSSSTHLMYKNSFKFSSTCVRSTSLCSGHDLGGCRPPPPAPAGGSAPVRTQAPLPEPDRS